MKNHDLSLLTRPFAFLLIASVLIAGCARTHQNPPAGILPLVKDAVQRASDISKQKLHYDQAEVYVEVWIVSAGEYAQYSGYAYSVKDQKYDGVACLGIQEKNPSAIVSWRPKSGWELIERTFADKKMLSLKDDVRQPRYPDVVDGQMLFLRIKRDDRLTESVFFYPWKRRDAAEKLAADAAALVMNQAELLGKR